MYVEYVADVAERSSEASFEIGILVNRCLFLCVIILCVWRVGFSFDSYVFLVDDLF